MSRSTVYVASDAFHTVVTAVALTLWGSVFGVALVTLAALVWHPLRIFFERRMSHSRGRARSRARGPGYGTMPRRPRQEAADPYPSLGTVGTDQVHAMSGRSTIFDVDDHPHCQACRVTRHMEDHRRTAGFWDEPGEPWCGEPGCGETFTPWADGDRHPDAAEVVGHCLPTAGHGGRHRNSEYDLGRWGHYDIPVAQPPSRAEFTQPATEWLGEDMTGPV